MRNITTEIVQAFKAHLYLNEKSKATVEKYVLAVQRLAGVQGKAAESAAAGLSE